ncbi:YciI family protein [Maritimibacter sp. DP1N21-5]|uniref:YciI family protein n=1 Tax=Maritimibacter sp. DP1N21-5 TaxID=2836867 RepID=UPI001C437B37|nr:YciI family protein [Maritimibacter sp. DP1N21-5]MBV7410962.1 YciI family protein [Maritimibacter sp. DP1N21-5]
MYALICTDKPGALDIRKANRDAHLAYIADTGVVFQAGPFLNAEGDMSGSLVILNVEDRDAAQNWAENDPYAKAGLFDKVRIEAWKKVVG